MNKIWIIILILAGIILLVLFLTKKKSCPGDGTCSGHGTCDTKSGKCNCDPKYTGDYCDTVSCDCSGVGTCDETGKCKCPVNYDGTKCEKCKDGWSGDGCTIKKCTDCSDNGTCGTDGKCTCNTDRWYGDNCELCSGLWSGAPVCNVCGCENSGICNEDGSCKCIGNWSGGVCGTCLCKNGGQCTDDGKCNCVDNSFWAGDKCDEKIFVAVGGSQTRPENAITWSADGKSWTGVAPIDSNWDLSGVTWNGKIFIAVGYNSAQTKAIFYSENKNKWTEVDTDIFAFGNGIIWNGIIFVAVGFGRDSTINSIAYSTDGINGWTGSNTIFKSVVNGITWNGQIFVAVGDAVDSNTLSIAYSTDGQIWNQSDNNNLLGFSFNAIANNGTVFVAVGYGEQNDKPYTIAWSTDGKTNWNLVEGFETLQGETKPFPYGVACSDKFCVAVGVAKNTILFSSDNGKTWEPSKNGNDIFDKGYAAGVTFSVSKNIFIAVGTGQCSTAWSVDGSFWTASDNTQGSTFKKGVV